jgi:hypothetical protein
VGEVFRRLAEEALSVIDPFMPPNTGCYVPKDLLLLYNNSTTGRRADERKAALPKTSCLLQ